MTERDHFYDNCKGLLMILVVLCHFLGYCITKSDVFIRAFILFIYYFHMPLFIFISGYFSKNVDKCREKAFRDLFMVFVVAQILWIIFKFLTNGSVYYLHHPLDPGYAIWYIVSLFFWRLFLKDIVKLRGALIIAILLSPLVMFLTDAEMILALNKTVGFLCFFLMGYYADAGMMQKLRSVPAWAGALGLAIILAATYFIIAKGILPYGGTKAVFMHTVNMAAMPGIGIGLLCYYLAIVVSVVTSVCVIAVIPEKKTFLCNIGGDTLPLYLSHTYFLILVGLLFDGVALSHGAQYVICLGISLLLIVIFSTSLYRKVFHSVYQFLIGLLYPKSPLEGK